MSDLRTAVARIVDPSIWDTYDYRASLPEADQYMQHVVSAVAPSLAKADTILSLISSREGVVVPRSFLETFKGNDPNDLIADGGVTVWMGMAHDAERYLAASPSLPDDMAARWQDLLRASQSAHKWVSSRPHISDLGNAIMGVDQGFTTGKVYHPPEPTPDRELVEFALDLADAPRDGTMIRLLVDYRDDESDHPLEDEAVAWTIGFNNLTNTGEDKWQFVGWSWQQDHFTDGRGEPLGWQPFDKPALSRYQPEGGGV